MHGLERRDAAVGERPAKPIAEDAADRRPRFRTVPSLTQVPGARERGTRELLRRLSSRYGVQFIVNDEAEPAGGVAVPHDRPDEGAQRSHVA